MRKFDCELVASFVPKKHQRLILHIKKANERRKQKKKQQGGGQSADKHGGDLGGRKRTQVPR